MSVEWEATIVDLKDPALEGQIELIDGKMVQLPFHTIEEARTVGNILVSLKRYEDRRPRGSGRAFMSTIVYVVDLPHRKTFSPDVSFAVTRPKNPMDFIPGAPIFAAEMRGPDELTAQADVAFAEKRNDYFAAGTKVVWDVDPWNADREVVFRDKPGGTDRLPARDDCGRRSPPCPAGKSRLTMSSSRTETLLARRHRSWYPTGHEAKGG